MLRGYVLYLPLLQTSPPVTPFTCHSYENIGGVYHLFPFRYVYLYPSTPPHGNPVNSVSVTMEKATTRTRDSSQYLSQRKPAADRKSSLVRWPGWTYLWLGAGYNAADCARRGFCIRASLAPLGEGRRHRAPPHALHRCQGACPPA